VWTLGDKIDNRIMGKGTLLAENIWKEYKTKNKRLN